MTAINCIVVDDNEIDRLNVEDYVNQCNDLRLLGSFNNAIECAEILKSHKVVLLFLDIDMPVINGIDFLKRIENPPLCIFITAFSDYAADAYDIHAIDYLLKPVKQERLREAIKRVKELIEINEKAVKYDLYFEVDSVIIKEGNTINKVIIRDIVFLEALANWTKVITRDKKYITLYNLKNFMCELPEDKFLRVHRSYAVAKDKINAFRNYELQVGEYKIPVGKTYRQNLVNCLAKRN